MLPYYLALGVSRAEIDISNPVELKPYEDAQTLRMMQQDTMNWYSGVYTLNAMMAAIDKAFNGKRSKMEYTEKPLLSDMNMTEEEKAERDLRKALAIENAWMEQASRHLPKAF